MISSVHTTEVQRSQSNGLASAVCRFYNLFAVYIRHFGIVVSCFAVVLMACSLRGDIVLVAFLTYKTYSESISPLEQVWPTRNDSNTTDGPANSTEDITSPSNAYQAILPSYLQVPDEYNMKDLLLYWFIGLASSQLMYQAMCSYFQWYYYTLQRDSPEKWKCQPHRFLTRSNELHEIIVGTTNMTICGSISGFFTCWIMNGNYTKLYFRLDEYGYLYLVFSMVACFLWIEAAAYYSHAIMHMPWLYKRFHKHHHRYHSPTAYSVIAMSPFEIVTNTSYIMAPMFMFPMNAAAFVIVIVYVYYYGVIDHSGVKMASWFPWQPHSMFHDNHHRYFHCNFGFNSYLFDWLHGTLEKKDRLYGEDIFWGKGRRRREKGKEE